MEMKLYSPLDCMIKRVESDVKLKRIVTAINDEFPKQYTELHKPIIVSCTCDNLTTDEKWLIKALFRKLGWKVSIMNNDDAAYTFTVTED